MSLAAPSPRPGLPVRILTHPVTAAWLFVFALFHGLFVDVISADAFYTLPALALSALVGLVPSFLALRRLFRNEPGFGNVVTRPLTYLFVPFVMAGVIWMAMAKSLPWTAAVLFGASHAESHEFTLSTHTRKGCNSVAKPVERLNMFGHLCVDEDYVSRHGHRIVRLRLVGDRTPLGFRITRVEHEAVLGPAPAKRHP
jgi:hypothetical protein